MNNKKGIYLDNKVISIFMFIIFFLLIDEIIRWKSLSNTNDNKAV